VTVISNNCWTRTAVALLATAALGCASTPAGSPNSGAGPRTRAERTNYLETSRYADVIAFLDSLKGRPELSFGSIGRTNEGREIPYVIASRPRVSTPEEAAKLQRPIVYVQGNIHAGEVEGKEALLALLRDLTSSRAPSVLDSVVLIAVPIYNADGNERFGRQEQNRGSQNGPAMVGVRANAQGLDLNRDYIKAEAPETRASLAMFNKWKPDVFVDLHTTNGSYHGYALTYAPPLNPASPLGVYTRDSVMPVLRQRMQSRQRFATFDYGDFISDDTLSKGWVTFDSRPRFGTNYYGLRGKISILSEAYSHDPFETRVKSSYAFVTEILSLVSERGQLLQMLANLRPSSPNLIRNFEDARVRAPAQRVDAVHRNIPIRARMTARPDSGNLVAEVVERTGDSTRTQPGVPRGRRRTGRYVTVKMPVFDRFEPTLNAPMPERYIIPAADTGAVRVLREHGITVSVAQTPVAGMDAVANAFVFLIDSTIVAPRAFQGHREMRLAGKWRQRAMPVPPGSFIVDTRQPLGLLAVYLLEPQSDDGLVTWNYFDAALKPGGLYPVFKVGGAPPTP
jgi:hypothetical protein